LKSSSFEYSKKKIQLRSEVGGDEVRPRKKWIIQEVKKWVERYKNERSGVNSRSKEAKKKYDKKKNKRKVVIKYEPLEDNYRQIHETFG